eukprot:9024810-Alexandrium_andersonii.AAC.1
MLRRALLSGHAASWASRGAVASPDPELLKNASLPFFTPVQGCTTELLLLLAPNSPRLTQFRTHGIEGLRSCARRRPRAIVHLSAASNS